MAAPRSPLRPGSAMPPSLGKQARAALGSPRLKASALRGAGAECRDGAERQPDSKVPSAGRDLPSVGVESLRGEPVRVMEREDQAPAPRSRSSD